MAKKSNFGLTESRIKHMLGVARKCYEIAKSEGFTETFCKKMWMIGYLHDIGYEFHEASGHEEYGALMLRLIGDANIDALAATKFHGKVTESEHRVLRTIKEWEILSKADLLTDRNGDPTTIRKRLKGIKDSFGEDSEEYMSARQKAFWLDLI